MNVIKRLGVLCAAVWLSGCASVGTVGLIDSAAEPGGFGREGFFAA